MATALLIGAGNTLSVLIAARLVRRLAGGAMPFTRPVDVFRFLTVGTMPGAAESALIGVGSLFLFGFVPPEVVATVFVTWWAGEMQGFIVVAPFLLGLTRLREIAWDARRVLEAAAFVTSLSVASAAAFSTTVPLTYLPIPWLLWGAFRFGLAGGGTAIVVVSGVAIFRTVRGAGPFAVYRGGTLALNDSLLVRELFVGLIAVMTLGVVALLHERRAALVGLQTRNAELATALESLRRSRQRVQLLEQFKSELSKFVPDSVKRLLERDPGATELEKRSVEVSVPFLDIAGYTRLSEQVEPKRLNQLIQVYFSSFLEIIRANHGDVNETAGDGLMVVFQPDPAARVTPSTRSGRACGSSGA